MQTKISILTFIFTRGILVSLGGYCSFLVSMISPYAASAKERQNIKYTNTEILTGHA